MKHLFLALSFCIIAFATQAQLSYGIKGGVNISEFRNGEGSIANFNAGGLVNINLTKRFSLQPELMYSGEGGKTLGGIYVDNILYATFKSKLNYNYLNLPVLLKYKIVSGLFAETGPQVGVLLNAKVTDDYNHGTHFHVKKPVDFAWDLGAGYQLKNGIGFNVRYACMLISSKENVFSCGAFYTFKCKKKK